MTYLVWFNYPHCHCSIMTLFTLLPTSSPLLGPWMPALLLGATLGLLLFRLYRIRADRSLPPSPPKHWFWGNKDIVNQPYRFVPLGTELKDTLGDIITTTTPFGTFITLNSVESATELLEKHASVTADRPRNIMVQEL
ncbi:hypothetical protein RSAG8_13971, partial [Rhizoctonia solani AG-8 WAC10335]